MSCRSSKSREFWEGVVAAAESGTGTRREIARRFGVGLPALGYWLAKVRRERGQHSTSLRLLPVRVAGAGDSAAIQIALDGNVALRFQAGTDPDYLAALVRAIRSATC